MVRFLAFFHFLWYNSVRLTLKTLQDMENRVDLRRNPYRGVIAEIAREQGVSEGSVRYALRARNPRICEIFSRKVEERLKKVERFEVLLRKEVV